MAIVLDMLVEETFIPFVRWADVRKRGRCRVEVLELATLSRKISAKSVASSLGFECLDKAFMSDLPDSELTILYWERW